MITIWTDERVDLLRTLWGSGLSSNEIARKMGDVGRNAVIGKAHRLGMTNPHGPRRFKSHLPPPPRMARPPREPKPAKVIMLKPKAQPIHAVPEDASYRRDYLETGYGQCKAIVTEGGAWPMICCAAPADGSYCGHHHAIYLKPLRKAAA